MHRSAAARRAAEERAGRSPVRARRVHGADGPLKPRHGIHRARDAQGRARDARAAGARARGRAAATPLPTASFGASGTRRVAPPDRSASTSRRALDMRERLGAMPFAVRENATGEIVGCTRYFNVDAANRRLEIGHTWYSKRVQRTRDQHRMQAAAADACVRGAALHRGGISHALVQSRFARRDRAARRQAGRRSAQPPAVARRLKRDTVVFSIIDGEWPAVRRHLKFLLERPR